MKCSVTNLLVLAAVVTSPTMAFDADLHDSPIYITSQIYSPAIQLGVGTGIIDSTSEMTSGGSRPLESSFGEVINIGQICDGTTDVTTVVKAAATKAGPQSPLHFPAQAGACLISSAISVASGTAITATPGTVTLKPVTGSTADPLLLSLSGVSGVTVTGLTIDGGGQDFGSGNSVVVAFKASGAVFDRVTWQNTRGIAVLFSRSNNSGVRNSIFNNIGNRWKTTGRAADRQQAIAFCCGSASENLNNFAVGNTFTDVGLDAVSMADSTNAVISNNVCTNAAAQWATTDFPDYPACIYTNGVTGISIMGNSSIGWYGSGLDISNTRNYLVSGNFVSGSGYTGIGIFSGYGLVSSNMTVNNFQSRKAGGCAGGICLSGVLSGVAITGNITTDNQATKTQAYGIHGFSGSCTNCVVGVDNATSGNAVGAFGGYVMGPTNLQASAGGIGLIGGAWTSYTPTLTAKGGVGVKTTLSQAAYQQVGKTLSIRVAFSVSYTKAPPIGVAVSFPNGQTSNGAQAGTAVNLSTSTSLTAISNMASSVWVFGSNGVVSGPGQFASVSFTGEMQ